MKSNRLVPAFLKRLFPDTLFGRQLLLLLLLITLAQAELGAFFRFAIHRPRMAAMQEYAVRQALTNYALLQHLDAAGRARWQATLGSYPPHKAYTPPMWFGGALLATYWAHVFMDGLQPQLQRHFAPGSYQLYWQEQQGAQPSRLLLGLRLEQSWYWLELDQSGLPFNLPPLLLFGGLCAALLSLLGAAWVSRLINRPLRQLAAAAVAVGKGQDLPPQLPQSPREIGQLATRMRQMALDLEAAERERALMLAGVSHDLRTPLAKLRLALEILTDDAAADERLELRVAMVRHINAIDATLEQFMAFARSGFDEPLHLIDLTQMLHELAALPEYTLRIAAPPQLPAYCRPLALRRALINLLENAGRYAGGEVELNLYANQGKIYLSVADRGPGIAADEIERMSRPFVRAAKAGENGNVGGSGLGLAIVERIMRLHHGKMQLATRPGGGLLVNLEWPQQNPPKPALSPQ